MTNSLLANYRDPSFDVPPDRSAPSVPGSFFISVSAFTDGKLYFEYNCTFQPFVDSLNENLVQLVQNVYDGLMASNDIKSVILNLDAFEAKFAPVPPLEVVSDLVHRLGVHNNRCECHFRDSSLRVRSTLCCRDFDKFFDMCASRLSSFLYPTFVCRLEILIYK